MVHFACMPSPIPPAGRMELVRSYCSTDFGLPTKPGRVGSCISLFEACSAFTHVTACTLAKSPSDSLHQRLQQFRCLHYCSDCYRVERTSSRAGLPPLWTTAFSRRTRLRDLPRVDERAATPGYQVSTREPWNEKPPIIISKDAAPIISFPMKNPTIATVNTA